MKTTALLLAGVTAMLFLAPATPAQALLRTFVSASGGGAVCSRVAPCATFQAAHDATNSGGEINCIDAGDFGPVAITKSITIDCAGTAASISVSSGNAIDAATAAPGTVVRVRNLRIDGNGGTSTRGINFTIAGTLFVENCVITGMAGILGSDGVGVRVSAPASATTRLFVSDTSFNDMERNGVQATVLSGGTARLTLDGVRAQKMIAAVLVNAGGGTVIGQVRNSVFSGNGDGLRIFGSGGTASVTFDRSSATLNSEAGVFATGSSAFVLLGRSTAMSNQNGLLPQSSAQILSYQNNHLTGNVVDGAPTGLLTLK